MTERGAAIDHSTIYRWVQHYAPEIEKRLRWKWRRPRSNSWRIDETYVKVGGKWVYLYRAVDKCGDTIDFYLSPTRDAKAAKRFLGKAASNGAAIAELKKEGKLPAEVEHRQVKYLNNVIEADHSKLKQLIRPVRGFKTMKTAYATIKGFEVMRALKKGQGRCFNLQGGIKGEVRMIERAFGLGPSVMSEVMDIVKEELAKAALYAMRDGNSRANSNLQQSQESLDFSCFFSFYT